MPNNAHSTQQTMRLLLSNSVVNALCYVGAQGVNFLFQLWLLHHLGKALFGEIGLAQLYVIVIAFVAELGMPSYFIRKIHLQESWHTLWNHARMLRIGFVILCSVGMLIALHLMPGLHLSRGFFLMAIPGMFFSACNPAPLLIGQGRNATAALGQPILWCSYALLSILALQFTPPSIQDYVLGAMLSLAYFVQFITLSLHVHWQRDAEPLAPNTARQMVRQSITIWLPGLFGAVYGLLLPSIVERLNLEMLPYFLLGTQIMQGISGINMQIQRLLLPILLTDYTEKRSADLKKSVFRLFAWLVVSSIVCVLGFLFALDYLHFNEIILKNTGYFSLMCADWTSCILCSFLVTALLAQHREDLIFKVIAISFTLSILLQIALLVSTHSLLQIMLVRIATGLLQIGLFHHLSKIRFSRTATLAVAVMLLLAFGEYTANQSLMITLACAIAVLALLTASFRLYRKLVA